VFLRSYFLQYYYVELVCSQEVKDDDDDVKTSKHKDSDTVTTNS